MEPNFIEYLTANEHIAYPFGENASALVNEWDEVGVDVTVAAPTIPKDFFSDAVLLVPFEYAGYLYLHSITCVTLTDYEFEIKDEAGVTIINFAASIAAPAPAVHSIIQEVTVGPPTYSVRILTGPSFVDYLQKIGTDLGAGSAVTFDQRLPFETGAVEFRPDRVEKVRFRDSISGIEYNLDEDVGIYEGFNIGLVGAANSITVLAEVGAGMGIDDEECGGTPAPSWEDTITSIQGAKPDEDGNINIKGIPSHRVEPDPGSNRIILYNDGEPCCLCQDYANTATSLQKYFDRLDKLWDGDFIPTSGYENFLALVETLNDHITLYNQTLFPNIRTFTFWGHIMVGTTNFGRGSLESSTTAVMSLTLTNRCSERIEVEGTIIWKLPVIQVETKAQGTDGGLLWLRGFEVVMEPFSELHFYWFVKSKLGASLKGLTAQVTAKWVQYEKSKTLTRTII